MTARGGKVQSWPGGEGEESGLRDSRRQEEGVKDQEICVTGFLVHDVGTAPFHP